jgi:hypothetical protein
MDKHRGRRTIHLVLLSAFALRSVLATSLQIGAPSPPDVLDVPAPIPIAFAAEGSLVSGIQFDLNYDLTTVTVEVCAGESLERSGKRLYTADVAGIGTRVLIVGLNTDALQDGVLVVISVRGQPDPGALLTLTLTNTVAVDGRAEPVPVSTIVDPLLIGRGQHFIPGPPAGGPPSLTLGSLAGRRRIQQRRAALVMPQHIGLQKTGNLFPQEQIVVPVGVIIALAHREAGTVDAAIRETGKVRNQDGYMRTPQAGDDKSTVGFRLRRLVRRIG